MAEDEPERAGRWPRWLPWAAVAIAAVAVGSVVVDLALRELHGEPDPPTVSAPDDAPDEAAAESAPADDLTDSRPVTPDVADQRWFTVTISDRSRELTDGDEELAAALASVEGESGRNGDRPRSSLAVPIEAERDREPHEAELTAVIDRLRRVPGVTVVTHVAGGEIAVAGDLTVERLEAVAGIDRALPDDPT